MLIKDIIKILIVLVPQKNLLCVLASEDLSQALNDLVCWQVTIFVLIDLFKLLYEGLCKFLIRRQLFLNIEDKRLLSNVIVSLRIQFLKILLKQHFRKVHELFVVAREKLFK